ncbi:hypothetical protein L210DRAFT_984213 [Boletus edulis BED1]|nr:hypothetical protein L210DRAFT_984213 [Boletus edulis BED1]
MEQDRADYSLATHTWHKLADALAQPREVPPSLPSPDSELLVLRASNSPKSHRAHLPRSISTRPAPDAWSIAYYPRIPNTASQESGLVPFCEEYSRKPGACPRCAAASR